MQIAFQLDTSSIREKTHLYFYADYLKHIKCYDKAEWQYHIVIDSFPTTRFAVYSAKALYKLGKKDIAITKLGKIVQTTESLLGFFHLATLFGRSCGVDSKESLEMYEKAVAMATKNPHELVDATTYLRFLTKIDLSLASACFNR